MARFTKPGSQNFNKPLFTFDDEINVPNNIRFRTGMDSEHELVEHVNGNDEADNLCEIEESLELAGMCATESMTVAATTYYEKDVDIEELLCDTPEPSNHESTTEDSVEDSTDESNSKELLKVLLIEGKKRLAVISDMERKEEKRLSELKKELRTLLGLILESLRINKSRFDEAETLTWDTSDIPERIGKLEKVLLEQEYELWKKLWENLDSRQKWEEYNKILGDCWEDFEEEDLKIMEECESLGVQMETQRAKMLKAGEEYFRKAGIII